MDVACMVYDLCSMCSACNVHSACYLLDQLSRNVLLTGNPITRAEAAAMLVLPEHICSSGGQRQCAASLGQTCFEVQQ